MKTSTYALRATHQQETHKKRYFYIILGEQKENERICVAPNPALSVHYISSFFVIFRWYFWYDFSQ